MATIKQGFGSGIPLSSNVKPDVLKMLVKLDPYRTPLLNWLMLSNKNSKPVYSAYGKFDWFKRGFVPHVFKVASAGVTYSSGWSFTSASFANPTEWTHFVNVVQVDDLILVKTAAQYVVAKINSNNGTTVTAGLVDGGLQSGQGANIVGDTYIRTMGRVLYDGHSRGTYKYVSVQEELASNYLKEFLWYVDTAGRQQAAEYFTDGMTHAERVAQKFIEAKLEIERYLWFATLQGAVTSGNTYATYGVGALSQISNTLSYTSSFSEGNLREAIKTAMRYGSGKKVLFAGEDLMNDIEVFLQSKYQLVEPQTAASSIFKEVGLTAQSFRTFGGITTLIWLPIFDADRVGDGVILDEEQVILRYMADDERGSRKLRVRDRVELQDADIKSTEILADVGIQITDPRGSIKIIRA